MSRNENAIKPYQAEEFDRLRINLLVGAKTKGINLSKIKIVNHEEVAREQAKIRAAAKAMFVN